MDTKAAAMFQAYMAHGHRLGFLTAEDFYAEWSETYNTFAYLSFFSEYTEDEPVERSIDS